MIGAHVKPIQGNTFSSPEYNLDVFQEMRLHRFKGKASALRMQTYHAVNVIRFYRKQATAVQIIIPENIHCDRPFR